MNANPRYDPGAPAGLRLAEAADMVPGADQALVAIRAVLDVTPIRAEQA